MTVDGQPGRVLAIALPLFVNGSMAAEFQKTSCLQEYTAMAMFKS